MKILNFITDKPSEFIAIVLSTGSILISLISLYAVYSRQKQFREYFSDIRKIKKITENVNQQGQQLIESRFNLEKLQQQLYELSKDVDNNKQRNKQLYKKLQCYIEENSKKKLIANSKINSQDLSSQANTENSTERENHDINFIFMKYNSKDVDYFRDNNFVSVKLTEDSEKNKIAIDGNPIIEFEYNEDMTSSLYLIFELQGCYHLIPNAINPKISRLIKLNNDSRIFEMNALSDSFDLKSAALVELIGDRKWKLISQGEFRDKNC